jgi:hypothetical protein
MKKRIITALILLVLAISSVGVFAIMSGAESPTPELSIAQCNLSFRDSICIKYAVKSNVSDVKILIWTEPEENYTVGTQDSEINEYYTDDIDGKSYNIFDYTALTAKQMTDVVYARAYARVDGVDYYSEVNKYSVLQYAYNKLGKTATASTDEELKEILTHMLAYGAAAQKYLDDYKVDRLATDDWYQVKVVGGVLDDGCTHGLYIPGDKVTMTAPTTNAEGASFAYWVDGKGGKVSNLAAFELTVGPKNEVYTPVYVKYSTGLNFDSNGDGTCYIISMGDCTDTQLVIPPVSPDNDTIIGIDSSAFAGEAITSVSFPSTIEEIGRRAFNGCTALTDVYYDGTEEEWSNISILTGNDPLDAAAKHFNEPVTESFTVTFIDHDGTVLKTETVESGKSATPPANPSRDGFEFAYWSGTYTNVTANQVVTATYTQVVDRRNMLEMTYVDNRDGTLTLTVAVKGNVVNFAGIEGYVSFDTSKLTYSSRTKLSSLSGSVNYDSSDSNVYFSMADSENLTESEELFSIVFNYVGAINTQITLTITDIYDQDYNTETYIVAGGNVVIE